MIKKRQLVVEEGEKELTGGCTNKCVTGYLH